MATSHRPVSVRIIEALGYLGVAVWLVVIIRTALAGDSKLGPVAAVGVILGGAHVIIAISSRRGSRAGLFAVGFVLVADTILAIAVDPKAWLLVGAAVILVLLAITPSARAWWGFQR